MLIISGLVDIIVLLKVKINMDIWLDVEVYLAGNWIISRALSTGIQIVSKISYLLILFYKIDTDIWRSKVEKQDIL